MSEALELALARANESVKRQIEASLRLITDSPSESRSDDPAGR